MALVQKWQAQNVDHGAGEDALVWTEGALQSSEALAITDLTTAEAAHVGLAADFEGKIVSCWKSE